MSENYLCKENRGLINWCYCNIRNNKDCQKCPRFKDKWEARLEENNSIYCHLYEYKVMKDCESTHLNAETWRYDCEYLGNWKNCPHKTPNDLYRNRTEA